LQQVQPEARSGPAGSGSAGSAEVHISAFSRFGEKRLQHSSLIYRSLTFSDFWRSTYHLIFDCGIRIENSFFFLFLPSITK